MYKSSQRNKSCLGFAGKGISGAGAGGAAITLLGKIIDDQQVIFVSYSKSSAFGKKTNIPIVLSTHSDI